MKIAKKIILTVWTIFCFIGLAGNYSDYKVDDWLIVIPFVLLPYLLIWHLSKKFNKHQSHNASKKDLTTEANARDSQYIENENIIRRTDGHAISDEEIPYLMQIGYEKAVNTVKTTKNPKFHRTKKEEELSFQFSMKYAHIVNSLSDEFMNLYRSAYKTDDLSERITLLEEASAAFEKAKKYCYSKGKGGTIYFQDMWEHMHNSQNENYSYLDIINNGLTEAIFERDSIIPSVMDTISTNDGILQKDIYKELPNIQKTDIQRIIRKLENENKLQRIKKSNSYELHLIN